MIVFERATITVKVFKKTRMVLRQTDLVIPTDRQIALLGGSEEDKRLLINVLGGVFVPNSGRIVRKAKVSFPVGHTGGFEPELSVRANIAHLARLYDADVDTIVDFVDSVANLGPALSKAYGLLPVETRRHLGRIVAYSIPFDTYVLADGNIGGKRRHQDLSYGLFEARARTSGMIIPIRSAQFALEHCGMGLVLNQEELKLYDNVEEALAALQEQ